MAESLPARRRNMEGKSKVKTGCATCRIRKVKCDEKKPSCQKCISTGRTCDGYEPQFRFFTSQVKNGNAPGGTKSNIGSEAFPLTSSEILLLDSDLLNRYFSTKTIFDVNLSCNDEARQVLQASLNDPPIRYAVLSLKALREDFETSGSGSVSIAQQTSSYNYGLQQYNAALNGLASKMSSPDTEAFKSVLLCCQVFISIEQVRGNFAAMALHINRGLGIMRECKARPYLVGLNELVLAQHSQLPFLDVFIIKLFAAPCKFREHLGAAELSRTTLSGGSITSHQQSSAPRDLRTIAPKLRTELERIAALTLEFLAKVSQVDSVASASRLISEKAALLDSLASWLRDLEILETQVKLPGPESISVSFMRCFHLILKIVLLGTLDSSPDLDTDLRMEKDRLQGVANDVSEKINTYRSRGRAGID